VKVDVNTCLACEAFSCDPPVKPGCTKYGAGSPERTECENVLSCIRTSNCINFGNVNCYCGSLDVISCKAAPLATVGGINAGLDECAGRIAAAFPGVTDSKTIVNSIGDLTYPAGTALALGLCDNDNCGDLAMNECVPYCTP